MVLFGCNKIDDPSITGGTDNQILIAPIVVGQGKVVANLPNTCTRTSVNGSQLGLFVTQYANSTQTSLKNTGNVYNNISATVDGSGSISLSESMFYPSRRDAIDIYAYLPYNATITPNSVAITTTKTQTATTIFAEDFLRGVKKQEITAASSAASVELEHVMSLIRINLSIPLQFANKPISKVTASQLLGFKTTANYNVGTDAWSSLATAGDVSMHQIGQPVVGADGSKYLFEGIVIPQAVVAKFYKIEVEFKDATKMSFDCTLSAAPTFETKKVHTYDIKLSGYGELDVTNAIIGDWTEETLTPQLPVYNTLRFVIFDQAYSNGLDKVEVKVGGKTYTCSKTKGRFEATPGFTPTSFAQSYDAYIPDDNSKAPNEYPYTINELTFYKGTSKNVVTANAPISAHGVVNMAIMNGQAITVSSTTIAKWIENAVNGAIPYDNVIRLHLMDQTALKDADKVVMTVNGVDYTCSGAKFAKVAGKDDGAFIMIRDAVLPDDAGKIPGVFPYVINKFVFYKGSTKIKEVNNSAAVVSANGVTEVAIYNSGPAVTITGKGAISSWENLLLGGSLPSHYVVNILSLSLWDFPTANMTGLDRVVITIKGMSSDLSCTVKGNKMEALGGTDFVQKYKIMIPDDANKVPLVYPYSITKLVFYNSKAVDPSVAKVTVTLGAADYINITENNVLPTSTTNIALRSSWVKSVEAK